MLIFLDHILGNESPWLPGSFCPDSHISCFVVRAEHDLRANPFPTVSSTHSTSAAGFLAVFYVCLKHFCEPPLTWKCLSLARFRPGASHRVPPLKLCLPFSLSPAVSQFSSLLRSVLILSLHHTFDILVLLLGPHSPLCWGYISIYKHSQPSSPEKFLLPCPASNI